VAGGAAGAPPGGGGERGRICDGRTAPPERGDVQRDRHAVQLDGPLDRRRGDGQGAGLVRGADDEQVRRHGVAEQRPGRGLRIEPDGLAARPLDPPDQPGDVGRGDPGVA